MSLRSNLIHRVAHLSIEAVDLSVEELGGLLSVGVVEEVLLDLLGLGGHLGVSE